MRGSIVRWILLSLPSLGLLGAGAWFWWYSDPAGSAWVAEQPEQVANCVRDGREARVSFVIRNRARRPLRVLGASTC
jgi:hypothetical protein